MISQCIHQLFALIVLGFLSLVLATVCSLFPKAFELILENIKQDCQEFIVVDVRLGPIY
jgi:hypothetical protein